MAATKTVSNENAAALFAADLELAKREARDGEPWEFIRLQWPHLIVTPEERPFFDTDLRLDRAQLDIIRHVFAPDHTECFIKGCTKYGKGFAVSLCVNIWFDIYPKSKIILTGPSSDHVKGNLYGEVSTLRRAMKAAAAAEIQTENIIGSPNHYVIIANPKSGEGFSGQHSEHTLFVFDEASSSAQFYYDNSLKQSRFIIALSNPRVLSGWFRDGFKTANDPDITQSVRTKRGLRRLVTASGADTINVRHKRIETPFAPCDGFTVGDRVFKEGDYIPKKLHPLVKTLIAAQVDYARYLQIMANQDESARRIFGEGKFPKEDSLLQVILGSWVDHNRAAYNPENIVTAFGLDVAASLDGDSTMLAPGGPKGCVALDEYQVVDTMKTVAWVLETTKKYGVEITQGTCPIAIDYGGGYGRGVGDRLRELGCMVIGVHPNTRSKLPAKYDNMRAELYGELGERLNPQGPWGDQNPWGLPPDQMLFDELTAQEKIVLSDGIKFRLIPKDKPNSAYTGKTLYDILHRSPDRSDAVALLWRAVSMTAAVADYSGRHLVYNLDQPEADDKDITFEEELKRDHEQHLRALAAQLDGVDSPSWR